VAKTILTYNVGCACLKEVGERTCELKRMFVEKARRGEGIATSILAELEAWAVEDGFARIRLETGVKQPEAIALYGRSGYRKIDNYGEYEGSANSVCMEKNIAFPFAQYEAMIEAFHSLMTANSSIATIRLAADKWTLNEMIGHLIDSASNNHQRVARMRSSRLLEFPGYDAEDWRKACGANEYDTQKLIALWLAYNDYFLHLIRGVDPASLSNRWIHDEETSTLEGLIVSYFEHLELHKSMFEERSREIKTGAAS